MYVSPLRDASRQRTRLLGKHDANVVWVGSHPTAPRILSGDENGELRIWSFSNTSGRLERTFRAPLPRAALDPTDSWMVVARGPQSTTALAYIWDLKGPPDAEPVVLRNGDATYLTEAAFHPQGHWLLTAHDRFGILWPLHGKYPHVLEGHSPPYIQVAFTPDGRGLVSSSDDGSARFWPLSSSGDDRSRVLMEDDSARLGYNVAVAPDGKHVLVGSRWEPAVFLLPLQGGEPRRMSGFTQGDGWVNPAAFSSDGRLAAAAGNRPSVLRIWDLESGEVRMLDLRELDPECSWGEDLDGFVRDLKFLPDGRLLTVRSGGIRVWDLENETSQEIRPCMGKKSNRPWP